MLVHGQLQSTELHSVLLQPDRPFPLQHPDQYSIVEVSGAEQPGVCVRQDWHGVANEPDGLANEHEPHAAANQGPDGEDQVPDAECLRRWEMEILDRMRMEHHRPVWILRAGHANASSH